MENGSKNLMGVNVREDNKIVPVFSCPEAATALFIPEKLIKDVTGHHSNALHLYERASFQQVSKVLVQGDGNKENIPQMGMQPVSSVNDATFSKLDANSGFSLSESSKPHTTFITPPLSVTSLTNYVCGVLCA